MKLAPAYSQVLKGLEPLMEKPSIGLLELSLILFT